jgi:hypothetical protein
VLFISVLPLLSASSGRRAVLGMTFAVVSLAVFRESKPFLQKSTNLLAGRSMFVQLCVTHGFEIQICLVVLAALSQYCTLLTFGAALVIEMKLDGGMDSFRFGCALVVVNMVIVIFIFNVSVHRYHNERQEMRKERGRRVQKIETATGFDKKKFETTLDAAERAHLPQTQALVFHYCSVSDAENCLRSGIFAKREDGAGYDGVIVTLHRPYELDDADKSFFPVQEAVLGCAIPWSLLQPMSETPGAPLACICMLSSRVLSALRSRHFDSLGDPTPWFEGYIMLPPKQIFRAYQLQEASDDKVASNFDGLRIKDDPPFSTVVGGSRESSGDARRQSVSPSFGVVRPNELPPVHLKPLTSLADLTDEMARIRETCDNRGWEVVYHYTNRLSAGFILKTGMRMSTQGQGGQQMLVLKTFIVGASSFQCSILITFASCVSLILF